MSLPSPITDAFAKVKRAMESLRQSYNDVESARRSGDEDKQQNAHGEYEKDARTLKSAADDLSDAARRL